MPCKKEPITLKVKKKTIPIIPIKAGIPVYFPVKNWSIFWLLNLSLLSWGFLTVCLQILMIEWKRSLAIAAEQSRLLSSSSCLRMCSKISFSFWLKSSCSNKRESFSASLLAAKRKGTLAFFAWSSIRCSIALIQRSRAWLSKYCKNWGFSW